MKKTVLALLFIVAVGYNSSASNNTSERISIQQYQSKVNTICKLIQKGNIEAVTNLINNGTDINRKSCGMTPLMYAARQNKVEIVKLLLSRSVKLKTRSDKGLTALDYAKRSKALESYELIAKAIKT